MPAVSSFIIPSFWYIAFGTYNFLLYFEDKIWEEEEKNHNMLVNSFTGGPGMVTG